MTKNVFLLLWLLFFPYEVRYLLSFSSKPSPWSLMYRKLTWFFIFSSVKNKPERILIELEERQSDYFKQRRIREKKNMLFKSSFVQCLLYSKGLNYMLRGETGWIYQVLKVGQGDSYVELVNQKFYVLLSVLRNGLRRLNCSSECHSFTKSWKDVPIPLGVFSWVR